jgi:hypothetical protein
MASRAPLSHEEPPLLALRRAPPPLLCGGMSLWRLLDGYRSRRQLGVLIYQSMDDGWPWWSRLPWSVRSQRESKILYLVQDSLISSSSGGVCTVGD